MAEGGCLRLDRRMTGIAEQGVFRSYLASLVDGEISNFYKINHYLMGRMTFLWAVYSG